MQHESVGIGFLARTYNADPGTLNSWTLTINHGSTATTVNPVTGVSGSGDTYYVTVSSTVDGTYNLDLVSSGHGIADSASNPLTNTVSTGADETYIVSTTAIDITNPRLASIERSSPTSQNTDSQSLIYEVTFSESVTGVTSSDFILSPDSTGEAPPPPLPNSSRRQDLQTLPYLMTPPYLTPSQYLIPGPPHPSQLQWTSRIPTSAISR